MRRLGLGVIARSMFGVSNSSSTAQQHGRFGKFSDAEFLISDGVAARETGRHRGDEMVKGYKEHKLAQCGSL